MNVPLQDLHTRAKGGDVRAQVRLGLQLELAGHEADGMDWLAAAARTGDPEALTQVGLRLAAGRFGAALAPKGAELMEEAAEAGSGEAAARLAVLSAAGVLGAQDWPRALDQLLQAAELGHRPSRFELAILADETDPPASWVPKRLRERIDIAALTRPPPAEVLAADPPVRAFRDFAPPAACAWIIEQARPLLGRAEVYRPAAGGTTTTSARNNQVANFGLAAANLVIIALQQRIAAVLSRELAMCEAASVLCYAPGEEAREHHDFLDPAVPAFAREIAGGGQRVGTGLVYLSDGFAGGETEFPSLGLSHRPRSGCALVFDNVAPSGSPDPRSLHAGRPPSGGTKWVLSCFVRDRRRLASAA